MNATAAKATPANIASSITRAWFGYFIVTTVVGMALAFAIGGIFGYVAQSLSGNPTAMRLSIWAVSILVNAPISFLVFHWAVRGKVLPALLAWNAGSD